ncbi:phage holin family protein [Streptomyces toxytricini]|uniref:Phage holin family protein n=1 Tax=Streptomyces toxytricini TaxID=67369 RepID=A0ABW8EFW8_STRT5
MAMSSAERATAPRPPGPRPGLSPAGAEPSLGTLVGEVGADLSLLVRDEIELAKAELKEETAKAAKAGSLLGGAGYAGHLALLLGSLTVVFALSYLMPAACAALTVTVLWAVAGAVMYAAGRRRMREVHMKPEQTVETLKEDARWARHLKS